jgi:hypothetical protein
MTHDHPAVLRDGSSPGSEPPQDERQEPAKLPTPHRPVRHNEWTRAKMVAFLKELAASQSVHHAARSVGMSRQSAYKLRNRLAGTPFALAWEVALEAGLQQLAHAVMDRALNGEEVPHYYHGELVGTYRKFDNRLAAWLLDNPWKVGREQVAREYVSRGWDHLLDQVEAGGNRWDAEDVAGADEWLSEEERADRADPVSRAAAESWYANHPPASAQRARR